MNKFILSFLFIVQSLFSQYTFKSQYLQTPEMMFGYVDSCAALWKKAYDPVQGGFYQNINQMGNLNSAWGTNKNTLNQSRDAYGFTRAFQLTGDTSYLRYAHYALNFMYAHSWDNSFGGWINTINASGTPPSPNDNKTAYHQHYALLGITAHYEATRDTNDWSWLMKGYAYNESKLWDSSPANFGYYDYVSANGTGPTNKSFNATVDALTTHVLHLYLLTGEEQYKTRMLALADNMINRLAASAPLQQIGFAEKYTTTWQINNSETMTIMGHVLKTGWCLARIYQLNSDPLMLSTAEQLVQSVLDKGYDHEYGGPYKDYNRVTGQMLMWGQKDTAKAWWQMEQAVTAGLMLYQLTGKEKYLKMADETLNFFMMYFVDHVYGDVFSDRTRDGRQIWGLEKGSDGKAAYHSIELGYYTYVYGKLLAKKEPITLYYRFNAMNQSRQLRMRPIGVPEGYLTLASVTRNGSAYENYDSTNLTLTLPAAMDGIFAVTYAPSKTVSAVVTHTAVPNDFVLHQNYPNPFNPVTTISFTLQTSGTASLKVHDALGREIAVLADGILEAGKYYQKSFDGSRLSSGIYFAV
ncbi:MAG: AGE family epimerase/isomerase, partial [Bacteroidota bacterium]